MLKTVFWCLAVAAIPASCADRVVAGFTAREEPIEMLLGDSAGDYRTKKIRVLVVGGTPEDIAAAGLGRQYAPATLAMPPGVKLVFPPVGDAYANNTESHVLWRTIAIFAPDLVLVRGDDAGLCEALKSKPARGFAALDCERLDGPLKPWFDSHPKRSSPASAARKEMLARLDRTPAEVARQLAAHYGHELPEAVYIPAVALMARLRMGALADVERIVAPYVDGSRNSLEKPTSSHLSGHLVFAELARMTKNPRYLERVRAAAGMGFSASGEMLESMPLHNEMSDSLFMGGPILAAAGRLTGETKYFDMCVRHLRFMRKLDLRADGLYRHSPLDETAWGRGNGFPALGLALTLEDLPKTHAGYGEMRDAFRAHMAALLRFQQRDGMWLQVVDTPGAYRELTATCMIAYAMSRGMKNGWLDKAPYGAAVRRAWEAVKLRVAADGVLMDVCASTGKQKSRRDYLNRVAIFDRDPRGGAMALLLAVEMAGR